MSWTTLAVAAALSAACLGLLVALVRLARAHAAMTARILELQEAAAARNRFVAGMSHELRTPLNAVIGFSELMEYQRAGAISETQREHLAIIRSSAQHILTLVDDALDMAKIEAGHMRLDVEPAAPAAIAAQCVTSLRPIAEKRHVALDLEPADLGIFALDPARLRQVILNYLSNAIRFTEPGGRVRVALVRDGEGLRVEVSDTGIGITAEDQARIFDEFVQIGRPARDGSGLGLAVTKQIVQALGGQVGVSSQPGCGSTFYAWLPCVAVDAIQHRDPARSSGSYQRHAELRPAASAF
jgi:signal transduction histidine kinase